MQEHLERVHGRSQGVGNGGWPLIRYFNKETGYGGKGYTQKTQDSVDEELGDYDRMEAYVTEYGGTTLCDGVYGIGCTEKELTYMNKWYAQKDQVFNEKTRVEQELKDIHDTGRGKASQAKKKIIMLTNIIKSNEIDLGSTDAI